MVSVDAYRILVADDNFLNRRVLQELLRKRDYFVHTVNDGMETIRALESGAFDLLILDCLMPGMDGYTVSRTIRAANRSGSKGGIDPEIPILALTALDSETVGRKCREAGMDDYMRKPFQAEALFRTVEELLHQKSRDDSEGPGAGGHDGRVGFAGAAEVEKGPAIPMEMFKSMSARIHIDFAQWKTELEVKLENQAFDDIRFLAHKIRGMVDLLGMRELSKLSAQLEHAAEDRHRNEVAARVSDVVASLTRCLEATPALE